MQLTALRPLEQTFKPAVRAVPTPRPPSATTTAGRLLTLRRTNNRAAARHRTIEDVVLYALCRPGEDPQNRFAQAQGFAAAHHCHVLDRYLDVTRDRSTDSALVHRPGWARARAALVCGRASGLIAVSRRDVSACDDAYEGELHWFYAHHVALWLVRPESVE